VRRRDFIKAIVGSVTLWPVAVQAQQTAVPVIGYLGSGSMDSDAVRLAGLRRGLNDGGYVEGQNLTIEYRWAGNQWDRLPALAADLVHHRVAVIVAPGARATFAAKAATPTIPIVFGSGADPVQGGLVASLNRPGGNLTGVNLFGGEMASKGLELLHELLPAAPSIGLLEDRGNPVAEQRTKDVLAAARAIGVEIKLVHAGTEREIDAAFASLAQSDTGALLVPDDIFFNNRLEQFVALAGRFAIPTICGIREFPVAGGLMSYGVRISEIYRLTGIYAARILKGEKPADLPVIQLTKIELVINLRTAKSLGITVPQALLARADEVIE
jgi:putative ABC transport system substrate-binding protein